MQEAGKDLAAPLLLTVSFRVEAESEQDGKAFDLGRIRKVDQDLEQAFVLVSLLQPNREALSEVELVEADRLPLARDLPDEVECQLLGVLWLREERLAEEEDTLLH